MRNKLIYEYCRDKNITYHPKEINQRIQNNEN